ncbi:MAG: hypothetical protein R3E67_07225 [Pseudomonadales bacterium]
MIEALPRLYFWCICLPFYGARQMRQVVAFAQGEMGKLVLVVMFSGLFILNVDCTGSSFSGAISPRGCWEWY